MSNITEIMVLSSDEPKVLAGLLLPALVTPDSPLGRPVPDEYVGGNRRIVTTIQLAAVNYLDFETFLERCRAVASRLEYPREFQVLVKEDSENYFVPFWPRKVLECAEVSG